MQSNGIFKEKKETPTTTTADFTIKDHLNNLESLVSFMERNNIKAENEADKKSADTQYHFAKAACTYLGDLIKTNSDVMRLELAQKMNGINKSFFGTEEIPKIVGTKSREFASAMASHFKDIEKVKFGEAETSLSKLFARLPGVDMRSIPDQVKHQLKLAARIEMRIKEFDAAKEKAAQATAPTPARKL